MSYRRVIPRDLFNEGNLLKCYGQLYLGLEKLNCVENLHADVMLDRFGFQVSQDPGDGSLTIGNVTLYCQGERVPLRRPLNSREPFPLYAALHVDTEDETEIAVFTDTGELTPEFKALFRP